MAEEIFPIHPRDWVFNRNSHQVGKVKNVYRIDEDICMDIVLYSHSGDRTGRESPICGGPRTYEPAITFDESWQRISEPDFPVTVSYKWLTSESSPDSRVATAVLEVKHLPYRKEAIKRRKSSGRKLVFKARTGNYDPDYEASVLRATAQSLRDTARTLTGEAADTLKRLAKQKEDEAARLSR